MRPNHHRNPRGGKRHFGSKDRRPGGGGGGYNRSGPRDFRPMNNLKETDVGITEFVGSTAPFNGVLKAKFSDFQVNEIDLDGNVVALTDLSIPEAPKDDKLVEILTADDPELYGLVSEQQWTGIKEMVDTKDKMRCVFINVEEMSKEDRTKVHAIVKDRFGALVNSSTVIEEGKKCIKVSLLLKGGKVDKRSKWTWPHEYTYFVMHKFNIDTMKACSELALNLNVKPSCLAYAGTKDKRANTSQLFCIKKRDPSVIVKAAQRVSNMYVGNFQFKPETLKLGHLRGNRFRIAIRQISVDTAVVEESLNTVKEKGFINYYGLQRFGNSAAIPTFLIGKALLQGKWSEAVELILKPRDGDLEFLQKAREFWWTTRDAEGARKLLHRTNNSIEAKLLFGLAKHNDKDFVNALENIPLNVRLLYLHAYQSLLWNKAASKRVQLGLTPIVGDLVFVDKENAVEEAVVAGDADEAVGGVEEEDEKQKEDLEEVENEEKKKVDLKSLVKPLTQLEIDAGTYAITDVVLPLPGHNIAYPTNEIGQCYETWLAEDGLSSEKMKQKVKAYSLPGAYRKLFEKPQDMTWKFAKYDSDQDMLLNTDFQLIKNDRLVTLKEEGALTACLLEFSLSSSTYATMALREILKIDTSTQSQIKLAQKETVPEKEQQEPVEKKAKLEDENNAKE